MPKYEVEIREELSKIIEIEAKDSDEAWDKAELMYQELEIVLDAEDFEEWNIYVHGEIDE